MPVSNSTADAGSGALNTVCAMVTSTQVGEFVLPSVQAPVKPPPPFGSLSNCRLIVFPGANPLGARKVHEVAVVASVSTTKIDPSNAPQLSVPVNPLVTLTTIFNSVTPNSSSAPILLVKSI